MESSNLNSLELQRLVDGELSTSERRAMLEKLDQIPAQWRVVGLAFLEDQAFRRESKLFGSVIDERTSEVVVPDLQSVQLNNPIKPSDSKFAWYRLATAACLLIAVGFGIGYGLRRQSEIVESIPTTLVESSVTNNTAQSDAATLVSNTPPRPVGELYFAGGDETSTDATSTGVPVFEVRPDHVRQMMQQQMEQVNAWNQQLRRRGIQVDWQPEMLESRLPDGRAVVVPVNQWNVRPLGQ